MLILYPSFRRLATTFSLHLSAACGGTSPPGEAPLEGETGAIGGPVRGRESLRRDGAAVSEAD